MSTETTNRPARTVRGVAGESIEKATAALASCVKCGHKWRVPAPERRYRCRECGGKVVVEAPGPGDGAPERVPSACPGCGKPYRHVPRTVAYGSTAIILFGVAAIVTTIWIGALAAWSPVYLAPRGLRGVAASAAVYLAPGLGIAWFATRLPRVLRLPCPSCHLRTRVTLK